jgi:phosphonate transport system permease protein
MKPQDNFWDKLGRFWDNIFKPYYSSQARTYKIDNNKVESPYPIALYIAFILIATGIYAMYVTKIDLLLFFRNLPNVMVIINGLINPNWDYFDRILEPIMETIQISIAGTIVGSIAAIPFAILSASNLIKNRWIYGVVRFLMSVIRTIPVTVYAALLLFIVGMGFASGFFAITIFTFSIVGKMLYEAIETIDLGPVEAIESSGATQFQAFRVAVIPQILGNYFSIVLYNLEINVRSASILGFVGAGGIGLILSDRISWRRYNDVGLILIVIFLVVFVIESLSRVIRKRLN